MSKNFKEFTHLRILTVMWILDFNNDMDFFCFIKFFLKKEIRQILLFRNFSHQKNQKIYKKYKFLSPFYCFTIKW